MSDYWPPPSANPGPTNPSGSPQRRGRRSNPLQNNPRGLGWTIAIVAVIAILLRSHKISSDEIIIFCVMVPSIILHEVSHGVVALWFGDDTAKRAGRLTLNPIPHIDVVGTLIVPALMVLSTGAFFGWAKPVPVNVNRLRSPRNNGVFVSLAGPATNMVLVAISVILFRALDAKPAFFQNAEWTRILIYLGLVNLLLAIFNMIPIPPLDGSVLFERLLPSSWWPGYLRIRPYTFPILIGIVLANYALNLNLLGGVYGHIENWWIGWLGLPT